MTAHDILNNYVIGYCTDMKTIVDGILKTKLRGDYGKPGHTLDDIIQDLRDKKQKYDLHWLLTEILNTNFKIVESNHIDEDPVTKLPRHMYDIYNLPNDYIKVSYSFDNTIKDYNDRISITLMKKVTEMVEVTKYIPYE